MNDHKIVIANIFGVDNCFPQIPEEERAERTDLNYNGGFGKHLSGKGGNLYLLLVGLNLLRRDRGGVGGGRHCCSVVLLRKCDDVERSQIENRIVGFLMEPRAKIAMSAL